MISNMIILLRVLAVWFHGVVLKLVQVCTVIGQNHNTEKLQPLQYTEQSCYYSCSHLVSQMISLLLLLCHYLWPSANDSTSLCLVCLCCSCVYILLPEQWIRECPSIIANCYLGSES